MSLKRYLTGFIGLLLVVYGYFFNEGTFQHSDFGLDVLLKIWIWGFGCIIAGLALIIYAWRKMK